ncbi:MAG: DUF2207 domain-containing protein [Candidatus Omnitrophica bacterium]|nr:DUF2207 domain-containing protein [Candidatus Omnitrophota bacterium]MCM8831606.1 DUF2207 domain-containing protein [Candidatus Omnitrophota bacterium]
MLKYKIYFFILIFLFVAKIYAWEISEFVVDIQINSDSSIIVTEKIVADFSDMPKHGIFREIPVRYRDERGRYFNFNLQILGIYDEEGNKWAYTKTYSTGYLTLKIGSPYKTYQTQKTFLIKYKVEGAILYLENHDQLYWNAIGTEWDVPINNVTVNVSLPKAVRKELLMAKSYSGRFGLRQEGLAAEISEKNIVFKGGHYLPYEGLTIVVGFPKGIVEEKIQAYKNKDYNQQNFFQSYDSGYYYVDRKVGKRIFSFFIPFLIPIFIFIIMFRIWYKYGKDPKLKKSIVVEYKVPYELTPIEIGTLIDDRVDVRDISATIIDLAIRGYLRIVQTEGGFFRKNYAFEKLKEYKDDSTLAEFEKIILSALFEESFSKSSSVGFGINLGGGFNPVYTSFVELSSLENNFYKKLNSINESVFSQLIKKGFYTKSPYKIVSFYRNLGITFLVFGFPFIMFLPIGLSLILSGVIILFFSKYMPSKTQLGAQVYSKILGFEEFLMRTDKDKIIASERQNIFEKMLPYAICLGISSRWAEIFSDVYTSSPNWFLTTYPDRFLMANFITDLNHSISAMTTTFISMPRTVYSGGGFGRGGFSGGGFGGGGGRSW